MKRGIASAEAAASNRLFYLYAANPGAAKPSQTITQVIRTPSKAEV